MKKRNPGSEGDRPGAGGERGYGPETDTTADEFELLLVPAGPRPRVPERRLVVPAPEQHDRPKDHLQA